MTEAGVAPVLRDASGVDERQVSRPDRGRVCPWCRGAIPPTARRDAITCSKRCRQARHRWVSGVGNGTPVAGGQPRRLAYADPPYPGLSRRYYRDHPDYAGEVDHAALIASLSAEYDAWALSTSAHALPDVLALCPPGVQVAAWVRGHRPHDSAQVPLNGWEPVIYAGQIRRVHQVDPSCGAGARTDALVYRPGVRLTDPARVVGAKPATFCRWIFDLLAAQPGDELVDVFPGSAGVTRAWAAYVDASC